MSKNKYTKALDAFLGNSTTRKRRTKDKDEDQEMIDELNERYEKMDEDYGSEAYDDELTGSGNYDDASPTSKSDFTPEELAESQRYADDANNLDIIDDIDMRNPDAPPVGDFGNSEVEKATEYLYDVAQMTDAPPTDIFDLARDIQNAPSEMLKKSYLEEFTSMYPSLVKAELDEVLMQLNRNLDITDYDAKRGSLAPAPLSGDNSTMH